MKARPEEMTSRWSSVEPERQPEANMKMGSSSATRAWARSPRAASASSRETGTIPSGCQPKRSSTPRPALLTGRGSRRRRALLLPASLEVNQALADRVERGLGAVEDLELLVHVADVVAHRLFADLQPVGDLLVGHPGRDQAQDLQLARGQPVVELLA